MAWEGGIELAKELIHDHFVQPWDHEYGALSRVDTAANAVIGESRDFPERPLEHWLNSFAYPHHAFYGELVNEARQMEFAVNFLESKADELLRADSSHPEAPQLRDLLNQLEQQKKELITDRKKLEFLMQEPRTSE